MQTSVLTKALGSSLRFLCAGIERNCNCHRRRRRSYLMQLEFGLGASLLIRCGRNVCVELFIGLVWREEAGVGEDAWKGIQFGLIEGCCISRSIIITILLIARVKAVVGEITTLTLRDALLIGATTELLVLTHQTLFVLILPAHAILDIVALPLLRDAAAIVTLELIGEAIVTPSRWILTLVHLMRVWILTAVEEFTQFIRVGNRNGTGLQYG